MPKGIDHTIVLMMENRSFDHLLGFLEHPDPRFAGLKGDESCPDQLGTPVRVSKDARYAIPSPDHSHSGVMQQLMGNEQGKPYRVTMRGFVQDYEESSLGHGHKVMRCFDPRQVPVISTLAREFAVCTRWHCSVPGETWPNREFVHSGTSRGRAENMKRSLWSNEKTIYEQLDEAGASWRIYHDDTPHTWAYASLWDTPKKRGRFKPIRKLHEDIAADQLPSYTFVEPDYGVVGKGNSQHPGQAHSRPEFVAGEQLIHDIYDTLRRNPAVFEKTVFVITYDEHGGFYDHVPPPATVSPDARTWKGTFAFDLLGVRVPAVIVSPWIQRHTVDETLYDHTAIIQTVRSVYAPGKPALTQRDKQANVFRHLVKTDGAPRRGSELPTTRPLTDAEAATLEAQLGGGLETVEAVPPADELVIEDEFRSDMRALSAAVGARLAASAPGLETVPIDPQSVANPAAVLLMFRATSED
jgi:phospholipase C